MKDSLAPGVTTTRRFTIGKDDTIGFMGEALRVYATPAMGRDIEVTCRDLVLEHLDAGEDTVGARIELDHLGATLLGMWVDVSATITNIDGRRITFDVEANDALDQVGRATHIRFVVDKERQKKRLEAKAAKVKELENG